MKKFLILALAGVASTSGAIAFANESNSNTGYSAVTISEKFGFSATYLDKKVDMKWNPYIKDDGEIFKYFKVVGSHSNPNPAYPEDGYLTYSADTNFSSYTDSDPKSGVNWYRICAIYEKSRICSPVVKVNGIESSEWKKEETSRVEERRSTEEKKSSPIPKKNVPVTKIDDVTKANLDALVSNFKSSLEAKYSSASDRITYIEKVISKAKAIRNPSPKIRVAIRYIVGKLEELKSSYEDTNDTIGGLLKVE